MSELKEVHKIDSPNIQTDSVDYLHDYFKMQILSDSEVEHDGIEDQVALEQFGKEQKSPDRKFFDVKAFMNFYFSSFGITDPSVRKEILSDDRFLLLFAELKAEELSLKLTKEVRKVYLAKIKAIIFEYSNGKEVEEVKEVNEIQEVDEVEEIKEVNEVQEVDEVEEIKEVNEVQEVDEVEKVKEDDFNKLYNYYAVFERIGVLRNAVYDTGNVEAIKVWSDGEETLKHQYKSGEIKTVNEYLERANVVFGKSIAIADDDDLNDMWKDYSDTKVEVDDSTFLGEQAAPVESSDEPLLLEADEEIVSDKEEVEAAAADVQLSGIGVVTLSASGVAKIDFGDDFRVDMHYVRNTVSNERYFCIVDENSSEGVIKVEPDKVVDVLDERHLDGYFTDEIESLLPEFDLISEVPDHHLLPLLTNIVGNGKERGFRLSFDSKSVLVAFAKFLSSDSNLGMSLSDKIEFVDQYISKRDDGAFFAERLVSGELEVFDEYHKEMKEGV